MMAFVRLVMAASDDLDAKVSAIEILPRLHLALRTEAGEQELSAVAVCEDGSTTPPGGTQTKAVKVLIEHRRGLTVALYLPWQRKMWGEHIFGEVMAVPAKPEVHAWSRGVRT